MEITAKYLDKLYGGWVGKIVGVIHGADVEGWTHEKIRDVFGEINSYPYTFKNFCADDDINGPLFYQRVFLDYASGQVDEQTMALTLKNYVSDGHGFFWWGGYGISTENTAYENLKQGVSAPLSGSIELNGKTIAEQIGGQIFSDCWGFVCPGDSHRAAELAGKMSSVTHGGEGIYGGRFVAACVAKAFTAQSIDEIIAAGLAEIPSDCEYAVMAQDVMAEAKRNQDDWRKTFAFVQQKYGYQHYKGVCHIIPNAAVIVLSLVHGRGDFDDTINICNMCGWDTDCNVGNVGAILGAFVSASHIGEKWLKQVNDFICASSAIGSLNIQTVSQAALDSLKIAQKIKPEPIDPELRFLLEQNSANQFHFEFPTAIHAMRAEGYGATVNNTDEKAHTGKRSCKIAVPSIERGGIVELYHKSYYTPSDFNDSRYNPDFSPTIYPGDKVKAYFYADKNCTGEVKLVPFWTDRIKSEVYNLQQSAMVLTAGTWQEIEFTLPYAENAIVEKVGFKIIAMSPTTVNERPDIILYMDDFSVTPIANYEMNLAVLPVEKWNGIHQMPAHITSFSGFTEVVENGLQVSSASRGEVYTGSYDWKDFTLTVGLIPEIGDIHKVLFRVQGSVRSYEVSLKEGNRLALSKNVDGKLVTLAECEYGWKHNEEIEIQVNVQQDTIRVCVLNQELISVTDDSPYQNGCIGFGNSGASKTVFTKYKIESMVE
ncbi:ADP-ribosylglycohydrolase family protein [Scatolibacter rhodanostii]|uniref:ADP-ribosylglycohydrolase family protein n=1 Tax=Scatolibacter rhodanostii TaxID=2014781 RepID=UPI0013563E05|nr:ADP-ribosylglycohydrolase family protein [Scatolibacter rhodanostii]